MLSLLVLMWAVDAPLHLNRFFRLCRSPGTIFAGLVKASTCVFSSFGSWLGNAARASILNPRRK
jgi:hypothetical protein